MYKIYPPVKEMTLFDLSFSKKDLYTVFFNSTCVNVFSFLTTFINIKYDDCENADIVFELDNEFEKEEYEIKIDNKIIIKHSSYEGAFFAVMTLKQIFSLSKENIKGLFIHDAPVLKTRGLMIDISRNKVPTIDEIKKLIDLMSFLKMNHLELYVEGFSFYYPSFERYCDKNSSITIDEFKELEIYANARAIDLVPNQNGFGHMTKWLEKEEFKHLCEIEEGIFLWGMQRKASTLNPLEEDSIKLIERMYADFLPHTKSKYFNMNFDEPFELGKGKSKEEVEKTSKGKVYLDFTLKVLDIVKSYDKKALMWGDVLLTSKECIPYLKDDVIFVDWGYDGRYPFENHSKMLSDMNIKFMTAPGTTSWCSFAGRKMDYLETVKNSISSVVKYNGEGAILTDWGDFGHLQFPFASIPSLIFFALYAYSFKEGMYFDVRDVMNKYIYKDENNLFADLVIDLGNYYHLENSYQSNGTKTFYSFMFMWMAMKENNPTIFYKQKIKGQEFPYKNYLLLEDFLNRKIVELKLVKLNCKMKDIVINEIKQTIEIIKQILKVSICYNDEVELTKKEKLIDDVLCLKEKTLSNHKALWLARNKSGNLDDTISYLETFYEFALKTKEYIRGEN